jgi:hypothetical protein
VGGIAAERYDWPVGGGEAPTAIGAAVVKR